MASASRDKTVKIWNFKEGNLELQDVLHEHDQFVNSVCFCESENHLLLYSGDSGGNLIITDVENLTVLHKIVAAHDDNICSLRSDNFGNVLSCSWDGYFELLLDFLELLKSGNYKNALKRLLSLSFLVGTPFNIHQIIY